MANIIDGKALAKKIREELKIKVDELKKEKIYPKLAVIMVGDDPSSKIYVRNLIFSLKILDKLCNKWYYTKVGD